MESIFDKDNLPKGVLWNDKTNTPIITSEYDGPKMAIPIRGVIDEQGMLWENVSLETALVPEECQRVPEGKGIGEGVRDFGDNEESE